MKEQTPKLLHFYIFIMQISFPLSNMVIFYLPQFATARISLNEAHQNQA